eukprot:scaffold85509_cov18-Tisochrysis_lutea.AAC.1
MKAHRTLTAAVKSLRLPLGGKGIPAAVSSACRAVGKTACCSCVYTNALERTNDAGLNMTGAHCVLCQKGAVPKVCKHRWLRTQLGRGTHLHLCGGHARGLDPDS